MSWQQFTRQPKPDGPEIFDGPWLARNQMRKEIVLAKNFDSKEVRMSYILDYIPWTWRDIVCVCDSFGIVHKTCYRCNKYARYLFRRMCSGCSEPFVMDYDHPKKNQRTCFDCVVGEHGLMGGQNRATQKPRKPVDVTNEGVFSLPDVPSFNF